MYFLLKWLAAITFFGMGATAVAYGEKIAIVGATVVDTESFGFSRGDRQDAIVLIDGSRIVQVYSGSREDVPEGYTVTAAHGLYLIPGLIDAFGTMKSAGNFAQAYLRAGVTSVVAIDGGRRGAMGRPLGVKPRLLEVYGLGEAPLSTTALVRKIRQLDRDRYTFLHLKYQIANEQLAPVLEGARRLGLRTIGELGLADPDLAVEWGIDALVHTARYTIGLASQELREDYIGAPFDESLLGPKWQFYEFLFERTRTADESLTGYFSRLTRRATGLIPTGALSSLARNPVNPWDSPLLQNVDPRLIHCAADQLTGERPFSEERLDAHVRLAQAQDALEQIAWQSGARYLAGSAATIWGTTPGFSLIEELRWLVAVVGLTPRQALAAATTNFAQVYRLPEWGRIAPGAFADLLLLKDDPREDIEALLTIQQRMLDGAWIVPESLEVTDDDARFSDPVPDDELPDPCPR